MNELYCSEARVTLLKQRVERCVCKYCGSELSLKRIVFNDFEDARIEIFCNSCGRIEYGVEKEIYNSAKTFMNTFTINFFPSLPSNDSTYQMNIAKICEILAWGFKNTGLIDKDGFTITLPSNSTNLDECSVFCADEITKENQQKNE